MTEQKRRALPKSPIGQAIAYAQSNWAALCRYPEDGELSIDNNLAERMLRAQALGRKNWTFLGSDRGGRTAAVLYSFTSTTTSIPSLTFGISSADSRLSRWTDWESCCPISGSRPIHRLSERRLHNSPLALHSMVPLEVRDHTESGRQRSIT
jgi:hypothetical protein